MLLLCVTLFHFVIFNIEHRQWHLLCNKFYICITYCMINGLVLFIIFRYKSENILQLKWLMEFLFYQIVQSGSKQIETVWQQFQISVWNKCSTWNNSWENLISDWMATLNTLFDVHWSFFLIKPIYNYTWRVKNNTQLLFHFSLFKLVNKYMYFALAFRE